MDFEVTISGNGRVKFNEINSMTKTQSNDLKWKTFVNLDSPFGKFVINQFEAGDFRCWYVEFDCNRDIEVSFNWPSSFITIHLVLEGSLHWRVRSGTLYEVDELQYNIFLHLTSPSYTTFKKDRSYRFFNTIIQPENVSTIFEYFPVLKAYADDPRPPMVSSLFAHPLNVSSKVLKTLEEITGLYQEKESFSMIVRQKLVNVILSLLVDISAKTASETSTLPELTGKMGQVERIIKRDLVHSPDIASIASTLAISKSKLLKDFKKIFGMPPGAYWRHLRMQEAAELLQDTDKSVKEIASAIGFSSDSSFIVAFKESFNNITPDEWRKKMIALAPLLALPFV